MKFKNSKTTKIRTIYFIICFVFILISMFLVYIFHENNFNNLWLQSSIILFIELLLFTTIYNFFVKKYMKTVNVFCHNKNLSTSYYKHAKKQYELINELKNNNDLILKDKNISNALIEITYELLCFKDMDYLLNFILKKAIDIIPNAEMGSILILENDKFVYKACVGFDFDKLKEIKFDKEEIFQYNMEGFEKPCIVKDVKNFSKKNVSSSKFDFMIANNNYTQKAILSCAIILDGQLWGTINLDNLKNKNAFVEDDKIVIKHLADQIGIALKSAHLLDNIIYLSKYDYLTNIYNRRYFEESLNAQYELAKRDNQTFSFCIIDLNDFKLVNDNFGHAVGDTLLKSFATTVKSNIRSTDIFGRTGGDEFSIIFPNTSKSNSEIKMENIISFFENTPLVINETKFIIKFAYGVAEFNSDGTDIISLQKTADLLMYNNKRKIKRVSCE